MDAPVVSAARAAWRAHRREIQRQLDVAGLAIVQHEDASFMFRLRLESIETVLVARIECGDEVMVRGALIHLG